MVDNKKDLEVIVKAKELAEHTFRLTSNCNRYPKKYRFSLVDRMQNKSLSIYETLFEANRIDLQNKKERYELQTKVINYCDELNFYIELSMNLTIINATSVAYWSKLVSDIKFMTIAWRKKDKERV
jgi:hypothetical protein